MSCPDHGAVANGSGLIRERDVCHGMGRARALTDQSVGLMVNMAAAG